MGTTTPTPVTSDSEFCLRFAALADFDAEGDVNDADQRVELLEGALAASPSDEVREALGTLLETAEQVRDSPPADSEQMDDALYGGEEMEVARGVLLDAGITCGVIDP